uniref:WD repeat-containing protein 47 n=1 Tax=Cacopsylla melanoneura TaxID=428564 RepID=A0A8D9ESI7_9HEMI
MPSAQLSLAEDDVVRLTLEFLHNRGLHISQLSLERETGLVNGAYSDDVLFLRQLILDGQWEDVLEFIQPLGALQSFDMKKFRYIILRHKFIELICIKSETAALTGMTTSTTMDSAVDEMVALLAEIEKICPTKQDHINLCLLLTLPRLSDHLNFKDWNPSNARVTCFREVYPLVEKFLPNSQDKKGNILGAAKNDRLVQLVIKGVLYESCVKYCQIKATGSSESAGSELTFSSLLDNCPGLNESDLSLLSWLQSIPPDTFSVPFEQKNLNVDIVRLDKPSLETSWTEHMLITPIKPKIFPHSAMPFTRPRSASDMMSRSLIPGVEFGAPNSASAALRSKAALGGGLGGVGADNMMTRSSFASFHLTGMKNSKLMTTSVDKLFENDSDVFLSSSYHHDFNNGGGGGGLPSISELNTRPDPCPPSPLNSSPDHIRGKESSPASSCATARSSRRDSLSEKNMSTATTVVLTDVLPLDNLPPSLDPSNYEQGNLPPSLDPSNYDQGDLLKEFQRSKSRMQRSTTNGGGGGMMMESTSSRIMEDSIRSNSSSGNKSIPNTHSNSSPAPAANTVIVKSAADPHQIQQVPKTNGFAANNGDSSYDVVKVSQPNKTELKIATGKINHNTLSVFYLYGNIRNSGIFAFFNWIKPKEVTGGDIPQYLD